MRPALVLLAAGALDYQGTHHHDMAAVIEFIHAATLLHDDVVDESALRRVGVIMANAMFGNTRRVLVGDFLYSAFQMMVEVDDMRVSSSFDATNIICGRGSSAADATMQTSTKHVICRLFTTKQRSSFFEAAARLGAILAKSFRG